MDTEALKKSLLKKFQEVTADRLQKIQLGRHRPREAHRATGRGRRRARAAHDEGRGPHAGPGRHRPARARRRGRAQGRARGQGRHRRWPPICCCARATSLSDLLEDLPTARSTGTAASAGDGARRWPTASGHPVPALHPAAQGGRAAAARPRRTRLVRGAGRAAERRRRAASGARAAAPAWRPPAAAPRRGRAEEEERAQRPSRPDRSIRVNVEMLDALGLLAGDLLVESARGRLRSDELGALLERFSRLGDRFLQLRRGAARPETRMRTELDALESDLHLLRDDAFRFVRRNADGINTLHGNLAQLADHVAEARLVPLSTVFEAFPRAVRDIARDAGQGGRPRHRERRRRRGPLHAGRRARRAGAPAAQRGGPRPRGAGLPPAAGQARRGPAAHPRARRRRHAPHRGGGRRPRHGPRAAAARRRSPSASVSQAQAAALSEREAIELIFLAGFSTRERGQRALRPRRGHGRGEAQGGGAGRLGVRAPAGWAAAPPSRCACRSRWR